MRYVKPCSLFYEMLKSAMELADKKPLGPQLLGLNILEKHVTISISEPRLSISYTLWIPGPFDRRWHSESQKALYLQKLNQVKVEAKIRDLRSMLCLFNA
ncbi:hypothetical protein Ddye_024656 [Dipteronia dyeriana]|uniref:Uncharacterized protein n=1 Tax=Dipteronia dyeriana TaxID=168575 RepID=A0AAD9TW96_9ROSI|nr:hypothetical protein Ddye_024656 [Dipteronia dyeriana]